jgi:hypothetical protein
LRARPIDDQRDRADRDQEQECSTPHASPSSMCPSPRSS